MPGAGWKLFGCLGSCETGQEFSQGSVFFRDWWSQLGPPHLHFSSLDVGRRSHVSGEQWTSKHLINFSAYSWHRQLLPMHERSCSALHSFIPSFCWGMFSEHFPAKPIFIPVITSSTADWMAVIVDLRLHFPILNRDFIKQQGHFCIGVLLSKVLT